MTQALYAHMNNKTKKNPSQKRAGRVALGVDPQFKPQYCKVK
jgi:hypothetical protein